jgi:hypothetical protein
MPSPSQHVELACYADDPAMIDRTPHQPALLSYLESCLSDVRAASDRKQDHHRRLEEHRDALR